MKNLLITFMAIAATLVLSGCSTYNIQYEKYSIERDLNQNIDKINNKSVKIIDSSDQKLTRELGLAIKGAKSPFMSFELEASTINKEISKEFINQYFNNNTSGEEVFVINSKIKDFLISKSLNPNNMNVELEMEFTVTKNGKNILTKSYKKEAAGIVIWETRLTVLDTTYRKLQKTVLSIYENEFKKDLLEALRKNS